MADEYSQGEIDALVAHYSNGLHGLRDFAQDQLRVDTKEGGSPVPLIYNDAQEHVLRTLQPQLDKYGWIRAITLKSRRLGMSTLAVSYLYRGVIYNEGTNAAILTHLDDSSQALFRMVETFQDHVHPQLRPQATVDSARSLRFGKLRSGFAVMTAGTKAAGRAFTLHHLLLSEMAFYLPNSQHMAGVVQAVSRKRGTSIWIESTANGVGGTFHDMYWAAVRGDNEYVPIFIPWHADPGNVATPEPGMRLTPEEIELQREYGLSKEQLMWRRVKISELALAPSQGGNPTDLFNQEHPINEHVAFILSGRLAFGPELMKAAEELCRPAKIRAEMNLDTGMLKREDRGRIHIWEEPIAGMTYYIGADVAEGIVDGDNSAAYIVREDTGATVAAFHGHIDPDQFGHVLYWLGRKYGKRTIIGVEANNHGLTTLVKLRDLKYSFIYQREDIAAVGKGDKQKRLGWLTTSKNKGHLIDALAVDLRDSPEALRDPALLHEMFTYVIDEKGRYNAKEGCHDDRVIARALASKMREMHQFGRRQMTPQDKARIEKQRKEAAELTQQRTYGVKTERRFFATEPRDKSWKPAPKSAKSPKEDKLETIEDLKRAVKELRDNSPIKAYVPNKDIPVPEDPPPRRRRQFGG